MPVFLTAENLKPFISNELVGNYNPVPFRPLSGGGVAMGYRAELLPQICNRRGSISNPDCGRMGRSARSVGRVTQHEPRRHLRNLDTAPELHLDALTGVETMCEEPALGPRLDWVIVGGESGRGARRSHIAHVRSVVKDCRRTKVVAVFVKQLGAFVVDRNDAGGAPAWRDWNGRLACSSASCGWTEPKPRHETASLLEQDSDAQRKGKR